MKRTFYAAFFFHVHLLKENGNFSPIHIVVLSASEVKQEYVFYSNIADSKVARDKLKKAFPLSTPNLRHPISSITVYLLKR